MSTDLLQAAKDLIKAFNDVADGYSPDYNNLVSKMGTDIVLKKVVHPGSKIGNAVVKAYLNNEMKPLLPSLKNYLSTLTLHPRNNPNGTYAQVRGTGDYYDGASTTTVSFTLTFVRNSTVDDWLLDSSFAGTD